MPKRSGKKLLAVLPTRNPRASKCSSASPPSPPAGELPALRRPPGASLAAAAKGTGGGGVKKKAGARLWMRLDRWGHSEVIECERGAIVRRAGVPARDLRILGPVFSNSSNIVGREKAIIINLEFIRAIVTADEVLLLDPLSQEVLTFVDKLRQHIQLKISRDDDHEHAERLELFLGSNRNINMTEGAPLEHVLPFEFQILEIALESICSSLEYFVTELEVHAYPILDELAKHVSTKNLERVRSLKSSLTHLLARVQKVRDEIEHLLDDNEDLEQLHLTRKQMLNQQAEALASGAINGVYPPGMNLVRLNSGLQRSASIATSRHPDIDVEDLEMLLEAYFMQLDGIRNRILSVREYIDDTEDYLNIQLDNHRNELIQLQLILTIASFAIAINTFIAGAFGMNIWCELDGMDNAFWPFVGGTSAGCILIFGAIMWYARWMKLLDP